MLEGIRKRRNSLIILLAFGAIIIVFVFWGVGPTKDDNAGNVVAVVDGVDISVRDYATVYKRQLENYKKAMGDAFTDELIEQMDLRHRTLDGLIERLLMIKNAKSKGIKISPEEVQTVIKLMPAFQTKGVFDKDLYFSLLAANRLKPAEFEKGIEADLLAGRARQEATAGMSVTDEEAMAHYKETRKKISLEYIAVPEKTFEPGIRTNEAEEREYLKKNGSRFMEPARLKAAYAIVDYRLVAGKFKPTEDELKEYYERNKEEFTSQEQVKARHILIRPYQNATDKARAESDARAKAETILKRIKNRESFPALAKEHSEDPGSRERGGDLGWFSRGSMVKQFEDAAFALKKGEASGIVETEYGFHIILVEDKKEGGVRPFDKARTYIYDAVADQKAEYKAREIAAELEAQFKKAVSLEELKNAANAHKDLVRFVATGFFTADDRTEVLSGMDALRGVAFSLKAGDAATPTEGPGGLYVIKALDKKDAHVAEYEAVKSKVRAMLVEEKAWNEARKGAKEIIARLKNGEDIKKVAAEYRYKALDTGLFGREEQAIPNAGVRIEDKEGFFSLGPKNPVYPEPVKSNDAFFVFMHRGTVEPDAKGFDAAREGIRSTLLTDKQDKAIDNWLKDLKAKAKIKVYEEAL